MVQDRKVGRCNGICFNCSNRVRMAPLQGAVTMSLRATSKSVTCNTSISEFCSRAREGRGP